MTKETTQERLDDLLHPVRMRIMLALAGSAGLTPLQIYERLGDIPQATLYRQISRLAKSGLLSVVDERPVRGTVEKVYALNQSAQTHLGPEEMAQLSKEDHLRYFTTFIFNVLNQFSRYLNRSETVDLAADGVGYGQVLLKMSDAELQDWGRQMNELLQQYAHLGGEADDASGRRLRLFTTIMLPEISGGAHKTEH